MSLLGCTILIIIVGLLLLGGVAALTKWAIKKGEFYAKDYRTQNEIDIPNSYGVGQVLLGLCIHPQETIKCGIIGLYTRKWYWLWVTIAVAIFDVLTNLRMNKTNLLYNLVIVALSIVFIAFTILVETFVYSYVANVKMFETEGKQILGIVILLLIVMNTICGLVNWLLPAFALHIGKVGYPIGVLDVVSTIWFFYIKYLLFKNRYEMTTGQSILRVILTEVVLFVMGIVLYTVFGLVTMAIILRIVLRH